MTSQEIRFPETLETQPIYLKIILVTPGIIWSLKFKTKEKGGIVELLIPTLNNIIRNQDTYFFVIMNNYLKIISVHGAPTKVWEDFLQKKASHEGTKTFWSK